MVKLVKVIENKAGRTTYLADDGEEYTLVGDLSTRGNNPGNISPSKKGRQFWIDNFGAIGFAPSSKGQPAVALFPDIESGQAAQAYLWQTKTYANKTIQEAADTWATDSYAQDLIDALGVPGDTRIRDLSPEQMKTVIQVQNAREGSTKLKVYGADGKPVSSKVAAQFGPSGAIRLPSVDVGETAVATSLDVGDTGTYKVKSGETLNKIAKANGVTVDALVKANGIADPNKIRAGQSLVIPGKATDTKGNSWLNAKADILGSSNVGFDPSMATEDEYQKNPNPIDGKTLFTLPPPPMAQLPPKVTKSIQTMTDAGFHVPADVQRDGKLVDMPFSTPGIELLMSGMGKIGVDRPKVDSVKKKAPVPHPAPARPGPANVTQAVEAATAEPAPARKPEAAAEMIMTKTGKSVTVGIHEIGGRRVNVTKGADGFAKFDPIEEPMLMREAKANTVLGHIIRSKVAEVLPQAQQAITDVSDSTFRAVQNTGNSVVDATNNTVESVKANVGGFFGDMMNSFMPSSVPEVAPPPMPKKISSPVKAVPKINGVPRNASRADALMDSRGFVQVGDIGTKSPTRGADKKESRVGVVQQKAKASTPAPANNNRASSSTQSAPAYVPPPVRKVDGTSNSGMDYEIGRIYTSTQGVQKKAVEGPDGKARFVRV